MENMLKEGFVLFNKVSNSYVDIYFEDTNNLEDIEVYDSLEEAQEQFNEVDNANNFTLREIKIRIKVGKEYKRKVIFEEIESE